MSTDKMILKALATKLKQDMRYFELVSIHFGEGLKRKCFLCLGKHGITFMRHDMNEPIKFLNNDGPRKENEGELMYAHIEKFCKDLLSSELLVLYISANACWPDHFVAIKCENRGELLRHMQCGWQTDVMWRTNMVRKFPLFSKEFQAHSKGAHPEPLLEPFKQFRWIEYGGYRFMLPERLTEVGTRTQDVNTGEYEEFGPDGQSVVKVMVQVHPPATIEEIVALNREHIWAVAYDYKAHLVQQESQFYVLRNAPRPKRMNLVGDQAGWTGWELIVRSPEMTVICIILRRMHIPPLCDNAQDIAIMMRCSTDAWKESETSLILEAHVIADSLSAEAIPSIYQMPLQAKLDGLRFDESGNEWIYRRLKMKAKLHKEAFKFVRSMLQLFLKEQALKDEDMSLICDSRNWVTISNSDEFEDLADLLLDGVEEYTEKKTPQVDLQAYFKTLRDAGEGFREAPAKETDQFVEYQACKDDWLARVARYFAWAMDGGFLGPRFTLDMFIDDVLPQLSDCDKIARLALDFLLHFRSRDEFGTLQAWKPMEIQEVEALPEKLGDVLEEHIKRGENGMGKEEWDAFFTILSGSETGTITFQDWQALGGGPTVWDAMKGAKPGSTKNFKLTKKIWEEAFVLFGDPMQADVVSKDGIETATRGKKGNKNDSLPPLARLLQEAKAGTSFNDNVMMRLIGGGGVNATTGYLYKQFGRNNIKEYYKCLAHMLRSDAGINLKSYICRIFCEIRSTAGPSAGNPKAAEEEAANMVPVAALLELLEAGHPYVRTYATAALVNLSFGNEAVKNELMQRQLPKKVVNNMRSKDDSLIHYTMILMVNMTKEAHHRYLFDKAGVLPHINDVLTSSYHQCKSTISGKSDGVSSILIASGDKQKILQHICSLIGHFCGSEEQRDIIINQFKHTVPCLVYIAENAPHASMLMSKAFFALKQICANSADQKRIVGAHLVKFIMKKVLGLYEENPDRPPEPLQLEFVDHVIGLLQVLCTHKENCDKVVTMNEWGGREWDSVFQDVERNLEKQIRAQQDSKDSKEATKKKLHQVLHLKGNIQAEIRKGFMD